jgi:predicted translin family RNA/ssDNA-binding protein
MYERNISKQNLSNLYKTVEKLLKLLMDLGYPFEFDSELICSLNIDSDCICPDCGGEDQQ